MRTLVLALALVATAMPLAAQHTNHGTAGEHSEHTHVKGTLPAGWLARFDRANASLDQVYFHFMEGHFHVTTGPSGIFYTPDNVATGEYRARASFTQREASRHPEAYGLFVGGQNLDSPEQDYLYFLVRQDGKFLVKHRYGAETRTLVDWTSHEAVVALDDAGQATNVLEVHAHEGGVRFLVNGTEVANLPRAPMVNTDGIVGFRINHNLDVRIDHFEIVRD